MGIALINANIIDGNGGKSLQGGSILIRDSKIVEISKRKEFDGDVQVLDVSGKTIMPGLIDCHMHFATWVSILASQQANPLMYKVCQTAKAMEMYLKAGCTTARDSGGLEIGWCQAQESGILQAPRIRTCITQIQPTNGMMDWMPGVGGAITPQGITLTTPGVPFTWADGPDAVRAKVREVLRYGAHFVKAFNATAPWHKPHLKTNRVLYTREELDALVDEAKRAGVPTEVHCFGEESMLDAAQAGADCITHGYPMTEQVADEMAERGTWWVPTLMIVFFHANINPDPLAKKMATEIWEEQVPRAFELAKEKGLKIAMGTDAGYGADLVGKELGLMVQCGISPAEAIKVSTKNAAELLRMDDQVGTLEPGKEADLLVVDGDPLQNIGLLAQIDKLAMVMQAGKPVSGALLRELPLEYPAYPFFSL